jgi:hypothetical protein
VVQPLGWVSLIMHAVALAGWASFSAWGRAEARALAKLLEERDVGDQRARPWRHTLNEYSLFDA